MNTNYIIETKNLTKQYGSQKSEVTDFIYDSENKEWVGSDLLHADGINYMGTIGK